MENEKRALLAVGLCLLVFLAWYQFSAWKTPAAPPAQVQSQAASGTVSGAAGSAASPSAGSPTTASSVAVVPEREIEIVMPGLYRAVVTTKGGGVKRFELLESRYRITGQHRLVLRGTQPELDITKSEGPVDLATSHRPTWTARLTSGFEMPEDAPMTLVSDEALADGARKLVLDYETPAVRLRKTLTFAPKALQVTLDVEVQNRSAKRQEYHLALGVEGFQDPAQKAGGMFSARVPQNEAMWDRAGKWFHIDLEGLQNNKADAKDLLGDLRWIGVGQQYFLSAMALPAGNKKAVVKADGLGAISVQAELNEDVLDPQQAKSYRMVAYAGPKLPERLDDVKQNGSPAGMTTSIDYTFGILASPMLSLLRLIFHATGSWPLAIVLLTLLVKLLVLYPSHRSTMSMQAMGELKPQIDAIQAKFANDKTRAQQEIMALYKRHNVNPMGGCLPIILQMPIYFALYSMLGNAVELYHVKFLWMPDLTAADPYYVLPLITGGLIFAQSRWMSPTTMAPEQKTMMTMMPIAFTAFTIFSPSGLTLYILTNTVLGMVQTVVMKKLYPPKTVTHAGSVQVRDPAKPAAKKGEAATPTASAAETQPGGPKGAGKSKGKSKKSAAKPVAGGMAADASQDDRDDESERKSD